MAKTDIIVRPRILAEQKGYVIDRSGIRDCVKLWDPMLQANRPYLDGSTAWPLRHALKFLQSQSDTR